MRATTHEPLSSSAARAAILSCHDELRGLVTETIHIADVEPLRAHARELYEAFEQHMDFEERILATALRDVIGWGAVLHAQMEKGHVRQRAILASATLALSAPAQDDLSTERLIASVRTVADILLGDLKREEKCLLTADLDAISIDSEGG